MFRAYNIRSGIIFSVFTGLLVSIPWLIRLDIGYYILASWQMFVRFLSSWFIHHFFLLYPFPLSFKQNKKLKGFVSIAAATFVSLFIARLFSWQDLPVWSPYTSLSQPQILLVNIFRNFVGSFFCYIIVYYYQLHLQLQQSKLENEYLKQDQLKAQLFSLQQQISPHFLFNSLSTLRTIAPDQETKAYVMQLANVYRYLLTLSDSQKVQVGSELTFLRSYLYILQERYEDALQVEIAIEERYMQYYMPALTLQILVENALKHNVVSSDEPLRLRVYTQEGSLVVANSYQPKLSTEESHGKGLKNINDRYTLLSGGRIDVVQQEGLFIVTVPLLYQDRLTVVERSKSNYQ